jgi:cytochrome P450
MVKETSADAHSVTSITTPPGNPGLFAKLLSSPTLPALAARVGAALSADASGPWRFGTTVIVGRHAMVREVLARDLDFCIAPVNAGRIDEVNGPFVLGMDRTPTLAHERAALYRAIAAVDLGPLFARITEAALAGIAGCESIDVVTDYARPIAAATAEWLFGVSIEDKPLFREVARAVFAHTFLNLSGDKAIEARAVEASGYMRAWFGDEIDRRLESGSGQMDMMGALLAQTTPSDPDLVRRTLCGMFVGSIDTTATAVAKIVAVIGRDAKLRDAMARDADDLGHMRGWCWEALRRWPHNPILLRQAVTDTMLGDVAVKAGDRIILWTQAAMQDASAFPDPRRLRPDRPIEAYLHFGDQLHACAGRAINAVQVPTLVAALLRRGLDRVGKIQWAGPFPDHLKVTFGR